VRQTRRLKGRGVVARADWEVGRIHADEVGVSPSLAPRWGSVSVPYSALLPQSTRGLIVAGRHLSSDASTHSFMREIPQCWLTGHAAGVGAALAAAANGDPANVPIADLQKGLLAQGAWLRQTPEVAGHAEEAVATNN
jgi:hypothetical protein